MRGAWLLLGFLLIAGCTEVPKDQVVDAAPTVSAAAASDAAPTPIPDASAEMPALADVSASLRTSAAEIVVPAGEFHLVRLVYTKEVWGETEPWDGDAAVEIFMAYRTEGKGVFMRAFGFASPFADDEPIRPYVSFSAVEGEGWAWSSTSSSCSGCKAGVPEHETAWLVGADQPVTLRVGIPKSSDADPEALWDRAAVPIRADAATTDAFTGIALRQATLGSEFQYQDGMVQATWSDAVASGVAIERTSDYLGEAMVQEGGIFAVRLVALETVAAEEWSYSLVAPGQDASWQGSWVHEPAGVTGYATLTGLVYPPQVSVQGNVQPGALAFEVQRKFTGASDPTGLVSPSYEAVTLGHAGVDLDALFGWDTSRPATPNSSFDCVRTAGIVLPACIGTPTDS